jgi:hypothetical protein
MTAKKSPFLCRSISFIHSSVPSVFFDSVVPTPSPSGPICDCSISRLPRRSIVVKPSDSGSSLILTLLLVAILSLVAVGFLSTSRIESIATKNFTRQNAASGLAELATQQAMAKIRQGFTVNGTGTTVITTQPGAIHQFVFSGGRIQSNRTQELFSGTGNASTSGTANLNNLQNPSNLTGNASQIQWTITGSTSERISVPMEEVTSSNGTVIGRIGYYVDDEGTKLNANSAIGNRTTLNAAARPQDIRALVSAAQANSFSGIVNNSDLNNSSISGWSHFFRPEQVRAALSNFDADDFPHLTTATLSTNNTANMTHLLTPWGTQRLEINSLSTNATDGTGDASVNTIHSALTNPTLKAIFGGDFATKYTSTGVKQIAANMLQMRDPNTATVNASFSYQGPLIGSRTLDNSTTIPQEYLGFAPYPVVSEVSMDVCYNNSGGNKTYLRPYVRVNIELYNPYPIAFNSPNATLEYHVRGLTWNMSYTINSSIDPTGTTYGPHRYGGYGNWTDNSSSKEFWSQAGLRDRARSNTQFPEAYFSGWNPYGTQGISIPPYSKVKYNLAGPNWGTYGQALLGNVFPFNASDITITSFTDVRCAITYVKILANSTVSTTPPNPNTVRDWVMGAEVGPFFPNNGNLSVCGGFLVWKGGPHQTIPVNTPIDFPRNGDWAEWLADNNNISRYSYQRLCPLIKTSIAASSNLTDGTRPWTANASTANQTFGTITSASGITTATSTELLNDANAKPLYDSANSIPGDPSYSNFNGNAIFANATLSNDMRVPELPSFSGNYFYTGPSDLGLVPTNQRWRRLRMQMQPALEGSLIPDWAMLDLISFGNSTSPDNAFNRMLPVNINGKFHLPGNATVAPRTIGVQALAQVLSLNGTSSFQDPTNPTSTPAALTSNGTRRFKGSPAGSTTLANIANAIGNMTWSPNSIWGNATTGKRWKIGDQTISQYILPSEVMEIAGVADAVSQTNYSNSTSHFKWNEGRASALIPAVTTRSSHFMVYAYAQALDKIGNIESEALTKTMVEVQLNPSTQPPTYTVKKLYTQPIPLAQ